MIVLPYEVTDESRNTETDLLSGDMAITLALPRPGTGDLTLVYNDEASARAGRALHRARSAFTLSDTENPSVGITYALGRGGVRLSIDEHTQDAWILVVSYREVDL
jgi:hypothetical protein